ncbi:hypothetical protein [Clostridium beijerinckii]|uniref:hypothetical protein n=1 Tax=Clostridium beijerinckii TaxID=1520 RepID=UPI00242BC22B|nr:hypothetical protein [Clostridium beijerinckii]MDG5856016.1 hypothetical protein [Clostridium beijerinckii]
MQQNEAEGFDFAYSINNNLENSPFDFKYEINKKILNIFNSNKSPENKRRNLNELLEQCEDIKGDIYKSLNNIPSNIIKFNEYNQKESGVLGNNVIKLDKNYLDAFNNSLIVSKSILYNIKSNESQSITIEDLGQSELCLDTASIKKSDFTYNVKYDKMLIQDMVEKFKVNFKIKKEINSYKQLLVEQRMQIEQLKYDIKKNKYKEEDSMSDITSILQRLDKIDDKIEATDKRIIDIDKRTVSIETLLDVIKNNMENNHKDMTSKLNNKFENLEKKISNDTTELKNKINDVDKKIVVIDTEINNNEKNQTNIVSKLDKINNEISVTNTRLTTIEAENKLKDTSNDRKIRQLLYPLIIAILGGTTMAIIGKILAKVFP